jgi:hypothetical protein
MADPSGDDVTTAVAVSLIAILLGVAQVVVGALAWRGGRLPLLACQRSGSSCAVSSPRPP